MVPEPFAVQPRTGCSVTRLATPWVLLPTVPATCVPWPLQSVVSCRQIASHLPCGRRTLMAAEDAGVDNGMDAAAIHAILVGAVQQPVALVDAVEAPRSL